jgi:transposase
VSEELLDEYEAKILPVLELAKKAFGSRNTKSPQHDASRKYTQYLVEYYAKGGSLLKISKRLGVTYAGVRRRVVTDQMPPEAKRRHSKSTIEDINGAYQRVIDTKARLGTAAYHDALRYEYEVNGVSLTKLAKRLGLSSANPLYYGVSRSKLRDSEDIV